jgi:hypothetical protein
VVNYEVKIQIVEIILLRKGEIRIYIKVGDKSFWLEQNLDEDDPAEAWKYE